jgi:hypothetical protein
VSSPSGAARAGATAEALARLSATISLFSGLLDRYYAGIPYFGNAAGTFIDQWDAAGLWTDFDGCTGNVWVYSATGGRIFCDAGNHDAPKNWADASVMQGTVTALWHAGPPGWGLNCGGPCFTHTGSHAVAVTPVSASLRLKASRYVTYFALPSVTFTAEVSPTQVGGRDVPFSVQSWTWVADTRSGNVPTCGTAKICPFSPSSSGMMRVNAIVNGVIMNKSVHIRVLCKSTGDSLLDSLPILDAMDSAWKASKATGPMGDRKERSWTVECTLLGECTWDVLIQPDDAPCHSTKPPIDPTGLRVAQGHIHPFNPNGFPNAEWIPVGLCPQEVPGGGYLHPGPSWRDASLVAGSPVPNYILDGQLIHALPTNAPLREILLDPKKILRKDSNGCTRV